MSSPQIPPPPPGQPQPAGYAPPMGHPPVAPKTNGWAITSLISGILLCVPFATSLVAVITGIVGIRKANQPGYGQKPMALAGLVLGVLGLVGWAVFFSGFGALIFGVIAATEAPRQTAREFVQALSAGDAQTARELSASSVTDAELENMARVVQTWGEFHDMTSTNVSINTQGGITVCELKGSVDFSEEDSTFEFELRKDGETWKVVSAVFR